MTRLATALLVSLLLLSGCTGPQPVTAPVAEIQLASGPMPGHSAMRSVIIWLQATAAGQASLDYWQEGQSGEVRSTEALTLAAGQQYAVKFEIGGLEPGTTYSYRVRLKGAPVGVDPPLKFHTQPLWKWRNDPPSFRVTAGSCAYINDSKYDSPGNPYGKRYDIFARIAEQKPDMMLWLGDNVYTREADFDSRWGMAERYRHTRALPELQALLRSTHHYAIWDDHDYGPNEANSSFPLKNQSLALFKRYWANPAYGLPEAPGIFTKIAFRDVDFFLLDDRYYRNSDKAPDSPEKSMLGRQQLAWLKDALLQSKAPFKIIANGSQVLNRYKDKESWGRFREERTAFMAWLDETKIPGVLFLSGDVHFSALTRLERDNNYPLYDLSCSPLTSGPRKKGLESLEIPVVEGTFVGKRNFCQLDFSGPRKARSLTITVIDADGSQMWSREIASSELRPPR